MAGIGRKIGPTSNNSNNQIRNAEAQQQISNVQNVQNPPAQSQDQSVNQTVQKAVIEQTQQKQQTQQQQNPVFASILAQLKSISTTVSQLKSIVSESSKDASKKTTNTSSQVELGQSSISNLARAIASESLNDINQRLIRIDNVLTSTNDKNSTTSIAELNEQLASFVISIGAYTNKLSSVQVNSPTANVTGIETSSKTGDTSLQYNTVIDTSKLEESFNKFSSKLEEILNSNNKKLELSEALANVDSVETINVQQTNSTLLNNIRETMIELNQKLSSLQKDYTEIAAKTTNFFTKNDEEIRKQDKRSDNEILRSQDQQDKLLAALRNGQSVVDKVANEGKDPQSRLDAALAKLREAHSDQKNIANTNMGAAPNADNNLIKFIDNWTANAAQSGINYLMGGGAVKFFKGMAAKRKEKKAIQEGKQAEAELIEEANKKETELAKEVNNEEDADLIMNQERTAIPDRPNSSLAQPNKITGEGEPSGVIAPSNQALSRSHNNLVNAIMLRNSAIDNFAESKEGKRSGVSAAEMKTNDPVLVKLEAQLVQLTLIRAALVEQAAIQKRIEREKELEEAFNEGAEEKDTSFQLIPIEKETVEKKEKEEGDGKKSNGLLGMLLAGIGSLFLGGGGFFSKIIGWITKSGLPLLGNLLKFSLSGLWNLIVKGGPALIKLLWNSGTALFKLISGPLGSLLKFVGGTAWNFIKNGFSSILNFLKNGLGKLLGGLFKGGGKLVGSLLSKAAPVLGPVAAAASVAATGYQVGKMLGKWMKMDEKMDTLFRNDKAEKSNDDYTASMKAQAEAQNKNRAIATASWEEQAANIKKRQESGEAVSTTEQAIVKAAADKNIVTRSDRNKAVMGAIKDAGDNLTVEDVNTAMSFVDTNLQQLEEEAKSSNAMVQSEFEKVKNHEFKYTDLFSREDFKQLLSSNKLEDCDKAIKMLQDENQRLQKEKDDSFWSWTINAIIVEQDKLGVMIHALLKKKSALREKEKFEKSKKELEELKKTTTKRLEKPAVKSPAPDLTIKEPSEYKKRPTERPEIKDIDAGIHEHKVDTNIAKDLTADKMVAGSSTFIDPTKLTPEEKKKLYDNLTVGGANGVNDTELSMALKAYAARCAQIVAKQYGDNWDEKRMLKPTLDDFRREWLKYFYERNQILYFDDNSDVPKAMNKTEFIDKKVKTGEIRFVLPEEEKPELVQDTLISNNGPNIVHADKTPEGEELTNEKRMNLNQQAQDKYNDELEKYEVNKSNYEKHLDNMSLENDEKLKEAFDSYVSFMTSDDSLGGTPETRKKAAEERWKKNFEQMVVLIGSDNGAIAMTKFEFFDKFYEKPKPPKPPTIYALDENEKSTTELSDITNPEEMSNTMAELEGVSIDSIETGENNNSVKNAVTAAKEASIKSSAEQQKQAAEATKTAINTAKSVQTIGNQLGALTNPASPVGLENMVKNINKANETKEVLVYPPTRAGGIMVNVES